MVGLLNTELKSVIPMKDKKAPLYGISSLFNTSDSAVTSTQVF